MQTVLQAEVPCTWLEVFPSAVTVQTCPCSPQAARISVQHLPPWHWGSVLEHQWKPSAEQINMIHWIQIHGQFSINKLCRDIQHMDKTSYYTIEVHEERAKKKNMLYTHLSEQICQWKERQINMYQFIQARKQSPLDLQNATHHPSTCISRLCCTHNLTNLHITCLGLNALVSVGKLIKNFYSTYHLIPTGQCL